MTPPWSRTWDAATLRRMIWHSVHDQVLRRNVEDEPEPQRVRKDPQRMTHRPFQAFFEREGLGEEAPHE